MTSKILQKKSTVFGTQKPDPQNHAFACCPAEGSRIRLLLLQSIGIEDG